MGTVNATESDFDGLVLSSGKLVVVDFWAPWCGPCRNLAPILEDLADDLAGQATIVKIDTEANPAIARRFAVSALPTIMLFKDGEMIERITGAQSRGKLTDLIEGRL